MKNKTWIKSSLRKPEQGKKVLCCNNGDLDVRQRFKDYWFPIPYVDSKLATIEVPELWQEISFPEPYTGYMRVLVDDILYMIDDLETHHPEVFKQIFEFLMTHYEDTHESEEQKNAGEGVEPSRP